MYYEIIITCILSEQTILKRFYPTIQTTLHNILDINQFETYKTWFNCTFQIFLIIYVQSVITILN